MMNPAQLPWLLLLWIQGATGNVLPDFSKSLTASVGESVSLLCTLGSCVQWFQEKPGAAPRCISCDADGPSEASSRFTVSRSGTDFRLNIRDVQLGDEAKYYCQVCPGLPRVSSAGTHVRIKREDAAPSVSIFAPSKEQLTKRSASLVCKYKNMFPADAKVSLKADGKGNTKDVENSQNMPDTNNHFSKEEWKSHAFVICEFKHKALS